jgi:hypothetical protein
MKPLRLSAGVLLLSAGVAFAQTTSLNPITAIIGPESSNCTNMYNSGSSATGCGQMLQGTWNQIAPQIGVSTAQYPTMASAPLSYQFAATAALYNQQGFGPWAPYDPKLAANIAANGGASAYAQPGTLSTNPADYASLDQPGGLQNYLNSNGAAVASNSNGLVGVPSYATGLPTTTAQPQISVNNRPGQLSRPYTWLYNDLITSSQQTITNEIQGMQQMVSGDLIPLLTLALMALAIRFMVARYVSIDRFSEFLITMAFVIPFVAVGSSWYQQYVVSPVLGLPTFFQQYTAAGSLSVPGGSVTTPAGTSTVAGVSLTSPAAGFDAAYDGFSEAEEKIQHATTGFFQAVWVAVKLAIAWSVIALAISVMFAVFLVATLLSLVVLVLGPVLIPCVLFRSTAFLFFGWLAALATIILSLLAIDIVLSLYLGVAMQMLAAMQPTGTPDTDVPSFWGAAIILFLLGCSMYGVKPLVERIGGGVAAGLDWAAYYATAGHYRDAARGVARTLRIWL